MYINEISNRTTHHIVFAIVTHHVSFCSIVNLFANGIDASIDITKKMPYSLNNTFVVVSQKAMVFTPNIDVQ